MIEAPNKVERTVIRPQTKTAILGGATVVAAPPLGDEEAALPLGCGPPDSDPEPPPVLWLTLLGGAPVDVGTLSPDPGSAAPVD